MLDYSEKVIDHFLRPRHLGVLDAKSIDPATERIVSADAGHLNRGDALRLSLKISLADECILDAKFQNIGTGLPIASSSYLCETIIGKTLSDAARISAEDLDRGLDGLPELKNRQPVLVLDALDAIVRKHRGQPPREKGPGDEPPLCTCFQVPESIIEKYVRLRQLKTVDQITAATGAGAGCHTCHPDLEDILERCAQKKYKFHIVPDDYEAARKLYGIAPAPEELAANPPPPPTRNDKIAPDGFVYPDKSPAAEVAANKTVKKPVDLRLWKDMSHDDRLKRIEEVLEHDLRPAIRTDGGDIKLVSLEDNRVRVTLHGHCKSCHSATSTLKMGVEKRLQEAVWPELEVEEVFVG
jgi:NifU-like protein